MRYWLFQNNQVIGPFSAEELAASPGFSAESLVCSEGRKGTQMGDWQRAGVLTELSEILLKPSRTAPAPVPAAASPSVGAAPESAAGEPAPSNGTLPPEPTLKDLAVLGTLQEKTGLLENSLNQLHQDLRARDTEIASLKVELKQKSQEFESLQMRVSELQSQASSMESLRLDLSKAREEEAHLAQTQSEQNKVIAELRAKLETVNTEFAKQKEFRPTSIGSQAPPSVLTPVEPPTTLSIPLAGSKTKPPELSPRAESMPALEMPPRRETKSPLPVASSPASPDVALADLGMEAPSRKKGKAGLIAAFLLLAAAGAGAGYYFGLLDQWISGKKKPRQAPKAPVEEILTSSPRMSDRTKEAEDFAKTYLLPSTGFTLVSTLEGPNPLPGLSPWMVERINGDVYRVNFYQQGSKTPEYEFEVKLDTRRIRGLNDRSQKVLEGKIAPRTSSAPPRRSRRRGSEEASPEAPTRHSPRPKAAAPKPSRKPETPLPGQTKRAQHEQTPPPAADQEGESIDDLLLPGVPKQRGK